MSKKFAAFDIDGTVLRWQLYHAISDTLVRHGHFSPTDFKAVKLARMVWKKRSHSSSYHDYEKTLVSVYDKAIHSVSYKDFLSAAHVAFDEYKDQTYTYTRDLIKQLKSQGYLLFAVSASQKEVVKLFADYYGFNDYGGSTYEYKKGRYTGNKHILRGKEKPKFINELVEKHSATYNGSIAVGDSDSDIPMLSIVKNPIVFNPNSVLYEHAKKQGWQIVLERKNVIYRLESKNGRHTLT